MYINMLSSETQNQINKKKMKIRKQQTTKEAHKLLHNLNL
jgi:hypothetical protein